MTKSGNINDTEKKEILLLMNLDDFCSQINLDKMELSLTYTYIKNIFII